jgi:hypothetical protein
MKITDEAVRAAAKAWTDAYYNSDSGDWMRAALTAALPHLTDDGAADTPPADLAGIGAPSAAESATTTAAPSSPHLYNEEIYSRVHHFMRGWDRGEVISASVTAGEGQALLTYSDLGELLYAFKGEGRAS